MQQIDTENASRAALTPHGVLTYREQVHQAIKICHGIAGISKEDTMLRGRINFLMKQLCETNSQSDSKEEARFCSTLFEIIAQQALHIIAQNSDNSYEVIFAPPGIFDISEGRKKGGDLLLVRKKEDDSYEAISLIDVTICSKSYEDLRAATNDGLGKRNTLPVIIVNMGNITWEDIFDTKYKTKDYLQTTARRNFQVNNTKHPLLGVKPEAEEHILQSMRACVKAGCDRSTKRISRKRRSERVGKLLEQIALTNYLLGKVDD